MTDTANLRIPNRLAGEPGVAASAGDGGVRNEIVPSEKYGRQIKAAFAHIRSGHPRLIATPKRSAAVRDADPGSLLGQLADNSVLAAERVLADEPVRYVLEGRRLLGVSREALRRLILLGVAWLRTREERFARRAGDEIAAVCAFPDWNPSHYLDTAEMALGVALAYDWMHEALDPSVQAAARQGLLLHALGTAFPPKTDGWQWTESHNNWAQVCHAGLSATALVLAEDEPELARRILQRAVDSVHLAGSVYAPDGDYPEGPIYWDYGTSFHVVLLELLHSALGADFGLAQMPGFLESAASILHLTTPAGRLFQFADGNADLRRFALLLWFDAQGSVHLPSQSAERLALDRGQLPYARLDPLAVFWIDRLAPSGDSSELSLDHFGHGSQPLATMRGSWQDRNAWFVGIKGGSPSGPHGHMDGGSFILEAYGLRWVLDLGAENYHRIESLGMDLWGAGQDSGRWRVFRCGTLAHSVPRIDGAQQCVAGRAILVEESSADTDSPFCCWDLSTLYLAAKRVDRRFDFPARCALRVTDSFDGLPPGSRVTFSFCTGATIEQPAPESDSLSLHQDGVVLQVTADDDADGTWTVDEADKLLQNHDTPLPGISVVCREVTVPQGGHVNMSMVFNRI